MTATSESLSPQGSDGGDSWSGKKLPPKKYVVRFSAEGHAQLDELIRKGKRSAQLLTKARILLKADVSELGEGWGDSRIAAGHQHRHYRADHRNLLGHAVYVQK
jgi:hypothetical protein